MIYKNGKWRSSYSQIDKYLNCPYSWHLSYVEKIRSDEKQKALEYGLTVHETLEFYFEKLKIGEKPTLKLLEDVFDLIFDIRDIPFDSEEEAIEARKEGHICLQRLYNPINELEYMFQDAQVLGVEEQFELKIEFDTPLYKINDIGEEIEVNEVYIVGFIDLVLKTKEGIITVDHKSGKTIYTKDKLAKNLQFPIYAKAIEEKYGELPIRSIYNFTKVHKMQEVEITEQRLKESIIDIKKVFKSMFKPRARKFPQTPKPSFMCYWCDHSLHKGNICPRSSDFKPKNAKKEGDF